MTFLFRPALLEEGEALVRLLMDADEDEERIRNVLNDVSCTAYVGVDGRRLAGAAVVRWEETEASEIIYIGVDTALRGQGYGKLMIAAIQEEMRQRGVHELLVGTGSTSLENIAFYQKCGFRMLAVRRDYFDYIQPPIMEHGILLRDMLVFNYEL